MTAAAVGPREKRQNDGVNIPKTSGREGHNAHHQHGSGASMLFWMLVDGIEIFGPPCYDSRFNNLIMMQKKISFIAGACSVVRS